MKHLLLSLALMCAFSTSVMAGEVPSVGISAPGPNGASGDVPSVDGLIPTVGFTDISDAGLNVIQLMLGVV